MRRSIPSSLLCLTLLACAEKPPAPAPSGLTTEQFIDLFVALRDAQSKAPTPDAFEQMKAAAFARSGARAENLERFVKEHSGDPGFMASVWDSVQSRITRGAEQAR